MSSKSSSQRGYFEPAGKKGGCFPGLKRLRSKTSTLLSYSGQGKCFHSGEMSSLPAQYAGSDVRASADSGESTHGKLCSKTPDSSAYISRCTWKGLRRLPKLQHPPTPQGMLSWCTLETEANYGGDPPPGLNTGTLSMDLTLWDSKFANPAKYCREIMDYRVWSSIYFGILRSLEELSILDDQVFSFSVTKLHSF